LLIIILIYAKLICRQKFSKFKNIFNDLIFPSMISLKYDREYLYIIFFIIMLYILFNSVMFLFSFYNVYHVSVFNEYVDFINEFLNFYPVLKRNSKIETIF